jgi:hypothetical protein
MTRDGDEWLGGTGAAQPSPHRIRAATVSG